MPFHATGIPKRGDAPRTPQKNSPTTREQGSLENTEITEISTEAGQGPAPQREKRERAMKSVRTSSPTNGSTWEDFFLPPPPTGEREGIPRLGAYLRDLCVL